MTDLTMLPDWPFLFTVLGIVLTIIGVIASIRIFWGKDLMVYPDYENLSEDKNDIIQRHKLTLTFQNIEKESLLKTDYLNGRFAEIEGIENLESLRVDSTCEFNTVPIKILSDRIIVENDFLEGKKIIRLTFIFRSKKDFLIRVRTKIIGGNSIDENFSFQTIYDHHWSVGHKKGEAYTTKLILIMMVLGGIMWQIVKHGFHVDYDYLLKEVLKWNHNSFAIIWLTLLIAAFLVFIAFRFISLFIPYAEKAKKEKIFFRKN